MKRITAKIEEYQKEGETKGKYIEIGIIGESTNGEYMLLNPTVDLSGVLMKQRILAQASGKKVGDSVMCSIWDNDKEQSQPAQKAESKPEAKPEEDFDELPF